MEDRDNKSTAACDEAGPSSSTEPSLKRKSVDKNERDEIVRMWKDLDETLETKAKSMNLTSLNVKSILHHLIKYPCSIDVLLGTEGKDEFPDMRMTRSHTHKKRTDGEPDDEERTVPIRIEPRTFLDLEYDSEYDDDFNVDNEPSGMSSEEDTEDDKECIDEEEHILDDPFGHIDIEEELQMFSDCDSGKRHFNLNESRVHGENAFDHADQSYMFTRKEDTPEYRDFINALRTEGGADVEEVLIEDVEDPEDEDYNYNEERGYEDLALDVESLDETRYDRTTEIPRYEIEGLYFDNIVAEKKIPSDVLPKDGVSNAPKASPEANADRSSTRQKDAAVMDNIRQNATDESCTLLRDDIRVSFRQCEIEQLRSQMEQHVQLLTQNVALCYHEPNLQYIKNMSQVMINELDNFYLNFGDNSIYNVSNLAASIETCHDIIKMTEMPLEYSCWARNTDGCEGLAPRPEAIAVLARSRAIRFPSLVPKVSPALSDNSINFLRSEDVMLAVALLQFAHLPRRTDCEAPDRYSMISEHCLPARTANKVRIHMKTMRMIHEKSSPLHILIAQAEQGQCKMVFPAPNIVQLDGVMMTWNSEMQPNWYKLFERHFTYKSKFTILANVKSFRNASNLSGSERVKTEAAGPSKSSEITVRQALDEDKFVRLGTVGLNGQPVIIEKEQIATLIGQLFPDVRKLQSSPQAPQESSSPQKKRSRKASTPVKLSDAAILLDCDETQGDGNEMTRKENAESTDGESDCEITEEAEDSNSNFPLPRTPCPRTPSDAGDAEFDEEPTTYFDNQITMGGLSNSLMLPPTPRGYEDVSRMSTVIHSTDTTATVNFEVSKKTSFDVNEEETSCDSASSMSNQTVIAKRKLQFENDMTTSDDDGTSALTIVDSEVEISTPHAAPPKRKKRSRVEKETMGQAGLDDEDHRNEQRAKLVSKVVSDVQKRLFMHQEMWESTKRIMSDVNLSEEARVRNLIRVLSPLPDVLTLMLLFTPQQYMPKTTALDQRRVAFQSAIEMMLDIEGYISAAKMKTPTLRQLFKIIAGFGDENLTSMQAAEKFFQLLGHERPLWEKIEKYFNALAYSRKCEDSDFEYVDLTKTHHENCKESDVQFEVVDDLDTVIGSSNVKVKGPLLVRAGQLMAASRGTFVPVDVSELPQPKWTKSLDLALLTSYNDAIEKNGSFELQDLPNIVDRKTFSNIANRHIVDRISYLLTLFDK